MRYDRDRPELTQAELFAWPGFFLLSRRRLPRSAFPSMLEIFGELGYSAEALIIRIGLLGYIILELS